MTKKNKLCGELNPFLASDPEGENPIRCGLPNGHKGLHIDEREVNREIFLQPHYSGSQSEEFWNRVNALPESRSYTWNKDVMYTCGVLLQEMESRILGWLKQGEQEVIDRKINFKKFKRPTSKK